MKLNSFYIILINVLFISACEKTLDLKLPDYTPKIVVEGAIEQGYPAYVFLTRNVAYFGKTDSTALANTIVKDAIVTISDGTSSEQLRMIMNPFFFPPYIYYGSEIIGEIGKTYTLKIEVDGQTITSSTTIPAPINYDSIWFAHAPNNDTLGPIWATLSDPPVLGNYYRIFTYRIGSNGYPRDIKFVPLFGSVYDDKFFNGKTLSFSMMRGFEALSDDSQFADTADHSEFGMFRAGDRIIVKTCTMDQAHYDFWYTQEQAMYNGDNPFTSPIRVKSNIVGGLGVWGGYGAHYDTVYAKK